MAHLSNIRPLALASASHNGRPRRLVAALAAAVSLGALAGTAPAAQASAYAATPNGCIHTVEQDSAVYDSYNHYEGDIQLISSTCNNGWVGQFVGNSNTWKTATVYIEYAYTYGYLQSPVYGYTSNATLQSPWYHGTSCYYAEVDLVDNRGDDNWVGTSNAGPGC
jgi:hypothetical protein